MFPSYNAIEINDLFQCSKLNDFFADDNGDNHKGAKNSPQTKPVEQEEERVCTELLMAKEGRVTFNGSKS